MHSGKIKISGMLQEETVLIDNTEQMIIRNGKKQSFQELKLDPPVSGTIYGTLLNYKGVLEKLSDALNKDPYKQPPKAPILYIKPANTMIGNKMAIPLPEGVEELEIGASLGIVIGRKATQVRKEEVFNYIAGYTIANDVSIPHESVYRPAISQKCRDGFCPVGPWVIERDAVLNPDALEIRVYINGELKQKNTTANLIRSVSQLVADVTEFMSLDEGDVLLVGVPENPPLAKAGDQVRIEIEGIGSLENIVVYEEELAGGVLK
ncbi:fumarylacetoacetate hydrolase family protein [Calidifontibacillus erzurumensis]|nr:fumarylacetoacetate hydrolase family protein [Calidifontibacillus erzurumensis]